MKFALILGISLFFSLASARQNAFISDYEQKAIALVVPRTTVERLLEPEFELASLAQVRKDQHVIFLISIRYPNMTDLTSRSEPILYDEFVVYIPQVRFRDPSECANVELGTFGYMPRLYLNHPLPVKMGVQYYGFNKSLARVEASAKRLKVATVSSQPLASAVFGVEDALSMSGMWRAWNMSDLFETSYIGVKKSGGARQFIWSKLDLNASSADVASLPISITIHSDLGSGLGFLTGQVFTSPGLNQVMLGSTVMRGKMTGSAPVACTSL